MLPIRNSEYSNGVIAVTYDPYCVSAGTQVIAKTRNFPPVGHFFMSKKEAANYKDVVELSRIGPVKLERSSGEYGIKYTCGTCQGFVQVIATKEGEGFGIFGVKVNASKLCDCPRTSQPATLLGVTFPNLRALKSAVIAYCDESPCTAVSAIPPHEWDGARKRSNGTTFWVYFQLALGSWFSVSAKKTSTTATNESIEVTGVTVPVGRSTDQKRPYAPSPLEVQSAQLAEAQSSRLALLADLAISPAAKVQKTTSSGNDAKDDKKKEPTMEDKKQPAYLDCVICKCEPGTHRFVCNCVGTDKYYCHGCLRHAMLKRPYKHFVPKLYGLNECDGVACTCCRQVSLKYMRMSPDGTIQDDGMEITRPYGWLYERPAMTKTEFLKWKPIFEAEIREPFREYLTMKMEWDARDTTPDQKSKLCLEMRKTLDDMPDWAKDSLRNYSMPASIFSGPTQVQAVVGRQAEAPVVAASDARTRSPRQTEAPVVAASASRTRSTRQAEEAPVVAAALMRSTNIGIDVASKERLEAALSFAKYEAEDRVWSYNDSGRRLVKRYSRIEYHQAKEKLAKAQAFLDAAVARARDANASPNPNSNLFCADLTPTAEDEQGFAVAREKGRHMSVSVASNHRLIAARKLAKAEARYYPKYTSRGQAYRHRSVVTAYQLAVKMDKTAEECLQAAVTRVRNQAERRAELVDLTSED